MERSEGQSAVLERHPEPPAAGWRLELPRGRRLDLTRAPKVMGVVNVTPDSFSDGGLWLEPARAIEHGLELLEEGADVLDLGAESTRPGGGVYGDGASEVDAELELERLLPVLEGLRARTEAPLSVDTRKGAVAEAALASGADLINDVSAAADPHLTAAVAAAGCPLVLMHSRGELRTMQRDVRYEDVVGEVRSELTAAVERARSGGVAERQLLLDPGIGFGKGLRHNLALLRRLDELAGLGRPLVVGASRKSFISGVSDAAVDRRLAGSLAAAGWAASGGAALVRVHDVAETVQFLAVWRAIRDTAEARG